MLLWKKMWNSRWWSRNGCDCRLKAKILIMKIQVNLCPCFTMIQHPITWIVIKILPLAYHHSHFLASTLDFTSFFMTAFLGATHIFTAGLLWIRYWPFSDSVDKLAHRSQLLFTNSIIFLCTLWSTLLSTPVI